MRQVETITIADVARSALACEGVRTRHLAQSFLRQTPRLADTPPPVDAEPDVMATAAALIELFADRNEEIPPAWATSVERTGDSIFLFPCEKDSYTYELCLVETPVPLRRRKLYAPSTFLTWA